MYISEHNRHVMRVMPENQGTLTITRMEIPKIPSQENGLPILLISIEFHTLCTVLYNILLCIVIGIGTIGYRIHFSGSQKKKDKNCTDFLIYIYSLSRLLQLIINKHYINTYTIQSAGISHLIPQVMQLLSVQIPLQLLNYNNYYQIRKHPLITALCLLIQLPCKIERKKQLFRISDVYLQSHEVIS